MPSTRHLIGFLPALWLAATPALAADAGVRGKKLVVRRTASGAESITLTLAKDAGIQKGAGAARGEPAGLAGFFQIFHSDAPSSVRGAFTMPEPWKKNRGRTAVFADALAAVSKATVRDGKLARVVTRAFGEDGAAFDLDAEPSASGGITTVLGVVNAQDGTLHRMCTRFAVDDGSRVERRTTARAVTLTAKKGVPVECPPLVAAPSACEMLNQVECLLPYPSAHFLVPAATPTGFAVRIPQEGVPQPNGPIVPASMLDGLDGFSPGSQILVHFPQGVDVAASNASRLLEPQCCGQPAGPPWVDTRTYTGRSLEPDSPTVLLDADTGARVLHFVENDARPHDAARELFFLRPATILTPGHRYVVAVRDLVDRDGAPVRPELPFRLLRDGIATADPALEARRARFEADVFPALAAAGIARDDLILAFDFVVGSEQSLSGAMRSMRDQSYAWLDTVEATPGATPFTITESVEADCDVPGTVVWRTITGTFQVPLFLTGDLDDATTPVTNVDGSGTPVQNGFHAARLFATLPCSLLDPEPLALPVLMGHGLFQTGDLFPTAVPPIVDQVTPWTGIAVGTDWRGLSGLDLTWVTTRIIGTAESELHNFPAFPARLRQGMLNTLVLARLVKRGLLNRHPAFQLPGGEGVFPGPAEQVYYFGVSLGGIMGTYLAGLTPDIERFALDVGAVNFSCLLPRATPFDPFFGLLNAIGLTDSMKLWLGIQLTHELWAQAEPVSVVHHVTADPLPGAGAAKRVLYTAAWLDNQVANVCTETAARTMGLPVIAGSYQQALEGMPDVPGPVESALVFHHLGQLDILNPAHAPYIPPLANASVEDSRCDPHGVPKATVPTSILQTIGFLAGGQVTNTCSGLCDGDVAAERPLVPNGCPVGP